MKNSNLLKQILFPHEHGSWGLTLEPLILGLLIAFSPNGLFLALASFLFFLAHQPVRIFFGNNKSLLNQAALIGMLYLAIAAVCLILSFNNSAILNFVPFVFALLLMSVFLIVELTISRSDFGARLIAPIAIDLIAVSIVLIGGMNLFNTLSFFVIIAARSVQSSFYVHEQLKRFKKKEFKTGYVYLTGMLFLLFVFYFALKGSAPHLAIVAVLILIFRSVWGFESKQKFSVRQIGILEFVYGISFVAITAAGYLLGV